MDEAVAAITVRFRRSGRDSVRVTSVSLCPRKYLLASHLSVGQIFMTRDCDSSLEPSRRLDKCVMDRVLGLGTVVLKRPSGSL